MAKILMLAGAAVFAGVLALALVFLQPILNRFHLFPRQAAALEMLRSQWASTTLDDGWPEFRGAMHNHSELSHDSIITFPEIASAARQAGLDFIFMSDHCIDGKADFGLGWEGEHDGICFVRGYEMRDGLFPWGLPEGVVLDNKEKPEALAARIQQLGGLLFIGHCEQKRPWELPQIDGMEIYNLHVDAHSHSVWDLLANGVLSYPRYPEQTMRLVFQRPADFLSRWDALNAERDIVGIGATDAHQNIGIRGFYTESDEFVVMGTDDDEEILRWRLNAVSRPLLRALWGPLEPGRKLFQRDLIPYGMALRFVNTHLLATECTVPALLDAVGQGRCFVGFDMLADATGFVFMAEGPGTATAVMGESIQLVSGLRLKAQSPFPCRFTIVHDGSIVERSIGRECEYEPAEPGKYRVDAELDILGEWTPWVYTNPIRIIE